MTKSTVEYTFNSLISDTLEYISCSNVKAINELNNYPNTVSHIELNKTPRDVDLL